jgi:hypothetical protein
MSKECTKARNVVVLTFIMLAAIIVLLSSCGSTKQLEEKPVKECCKKTAQAVYEYEGLIVK